MPFSIKYTSGPEPLTSIPLASAVAACACEEKENTPAHASIIPVIKNARFRFIMYIVQHNIRKVKVNRSPLRAILNIYT